MFAGKKYFVYLCIPEPKYPVPFRIMDNKSLIDKIAQGTGRTREEVQRMMESLVKLVGAAAADMDTVSVPSFGQFEPRKREERTATHPSSGARLLLPPKIVLTFKPSALLKTRIRESR